MKAMPFTKTGWILTILLFTSAAGSALNCSSKMKDISDCRTEFGEPLLIDEPFEAFFLDGFDKTKGYLLLSEQNLFFFDPQKENPITIYPIARCTDFSIRSVHLAGTILRFVFDDRVESFMLKDDRMIIADALEKLVDASLSGIQTPSSPASELQ